MTFKTRKEIKEWFDKRRSYVPVDRLRWAKEGRTKGSGETIHYTITYVVEDAEGNVIRSHTNDCRDMSLAALEKNPHVSDVELIDWIFKQGKQDEWFLKKIHHQEYYVYLYDPDQSVKYAEDYTNQLNENEQHQIKELERQIAKNERWKEACKWAKEHGVKYVSDRFNRFSTIRRNVIEAGLIEEWNAAWPEWSIGVNE